MRLSHSSIPRRLLPVNYARTDVANKARLALEQVEQALAPGGQKAP